MEEEIITPEEEVFDYHKLRYILDKDGYVCHCSIGGFILCELGECTEYNGEIPDGYATLEEWYDMQINGKSLNSWKIVDGNLVFDASRDYKLKILYDQQNNENSHVTRKEMGMASTEEINPYTDLFPSHQSFGSYIVRVSEEFNKVGNLPTEEVNLSLYEEQDLDLIELEFIGDNFLPNTATSSVNNGIAYTQNKDKTINISGTATDRSTLNLAGTDKSVRNILTFKGNTKVVNDEGETIETPTNYLLFGLTDGVSLEFYHYDGSDRTLVGIYNGGVISFEEDTNITQVVLVVDKGTTIDTTITPMLSLVSLEHPVLPMTKYKGNLLNATSYNASNYVSQLLTLKAGTYTVHHSGEEVSSAIYIRKANGTNPINGTVVLEGYNRNRLTFTLEQDGDYYIQFYKSGSGFTSFSNAMLNEGSNANPYEPYNGRNGQYYVDGVSTQEVRNGTNKFNATLISSSTGIVVNEDGSEILMPKVTIGNGVTSTGVKLSVFAPELKVGDTVYMNFERTPNVNLNTLIYLAGVNASWYRGTTKTITQEMLDSEVYFYANRYVDGETEQVTIINFRMVLGTSDAIWEQYGVTPSPDYPSEIINIYKAGTYNVAINNKIYKFTISEDLRGLPNGIGDRLWFDIDGINGINIEKKVDSVVLDGSENWVLHSSSGDSYRYWLRFDNFSNVFSNIVSGSETQLNNRLISNYFMQTLFTNTGIGKFSINNLSGNNWILLNTNISTLEEFKTWLSTHNTEVIYELATYTTSNIPSYGYSEYEYEEYKNNTTLIDLAGNDFATSDKITIKDNQIVLIKNGLITSETTKEEIYLGDVVMPRTYTPYTHAYCHQRVFIDFKYKDPRNVDITKINLKGLISITNIETEYNFTSDDLTKVQNYIMETGTLTEEEIELYDINGDGVITSYDYVMIKQMIDGTISNKIIGTLEINSTKSQRTLVLRDSDGKIRTSLGLNGITTPSLSLDGGKVYGEFVLFNGETNGDVTLKDDVSNYEYIEIFYKDNGVGCNSVKIYKANKKRAQLNMQNMYSSNGTIYIETLLKTVLINEDSITVEDFGLFQTYNKTISEVNTTGNYIYITRVVGYRDGGVAKIEGTIEPVEPEEPTDTPIEVDNVKTISDNGSKERHKFTLEVNEESLVGTKSMLSYSFKLSATQAGWDWANWNDASRTVSYVITIGNETYNGTIPAYDGSSTVTLKSGSNIEIEHDADGTKTIPISFTVTDTTGASFTSGNASASSEMVLTTIQ